MGDRAVRREPATPDDIAEMRKLTIEALRCGAFGFTTSRTDSHKTPDGELVPSRDADDYELLGIGQALGITGTGAFGMNSDFDDEEFELRWIRKQARETGRPVWVLLTDRYNDPQRWRRLIKAGRGPSPPRWSTTFPPAMPRSWKCSTSRPACLAWPPAAGIAPRPWIAACRPTR